MRFLALALALTPAGAAAQGPARELPGTTVTLATSDGWTLPAEYSPAQEGRPTFVLLHDARGRRQNWYWLARRLAKEGIGFLAPDLRGHGRSLSAGSRHPEPAGLQPDATAEAGLQPGATAQAEPRSLTWRDFKTSPEHNDWELIREDIAAAVAFLKENGVPEELIALGGADVGGSVAVKYAALNPQVPMVFLLSPGLRHRDVLAVNPIKSYLDRPILMVAAESDRRSWAETPILHALAKRSAGESNASLFWTERGHGTAMLYYNKDLVDRIVEWIANPIREIPEAPERTTGIFYEEDAPEGASPAPEAGPGEEPGYGGEEPGYSGEEPDYR